jgi:hypothetical protein
MDDPAELMVDSDSVLDEGSFTNEDECTVLDRAAWVIDGTSGFGERELTGHPETDGVWFVENVDAYLTEHIYDDTSLTDLIEETIRHVVSELEEEMSREMGRARLGEYARIPGGDDSHRQMERGHAGVLLAGRLVRDRSNR